MGDITETDRSILRRLPVRVYSPGQRTIDKYGSYVRGGLVDVVDVGSDEMQETIYQFTLTDAGRRALEGGK